MNPLKFLTKTFSFSLGKFDLSPQYWTVLAIIFLLFLQVLTLARLRYMYIHWSISKPSLAMIFWGFLLAIIIEGFFLISGRTLLTEILGWENAPKPISTALDAGRAKLVNVLGVTKVSPTYSSLIFDYQTLSESESEEVRLMICKPY